FLTCPLRNGRFRPGLPNSQPNFSRCVRRKLRARNDRIENHLTLQASQWPSGLHARNRYRSSFQSWIRGRIRGLITARSRSNRLTRRVINPKLQRQSAKRLAQKLRGGFGHPSILLACDKDYFFVGSVGCEVICTLLFNSVIPVTLCRSANALL